MATFIVKKTTELSEQEIKQSLELNNGVFKENCTLDEFVRRNTMNPFGYSYHTLMIEDDKIVGYDSGVPYYYKINGERVKAICNIDTMIKEGHRGLENFYDLLTTACKRFKDDGFSFVIGYPNDNAHPLLIGTKIMKDIGKMNIYFLPYRIGAVKPFLKSFNWLSFLFCKLWVSFSSVFASEKNAKFIFEKDVESFEVERYKQMDANYSRLVLRSGGHSYYKIMKYEGIKTAFLIDVYPKSSRNLVDSIKQIEKKHKKDFDLLLYPGYLPFKCTGLIKIPRKYEPKNFNFTGMIFDKSISKAEFYDITHWDTNLSNYDLI